MTAAYLLFVALTLLLTMLVGYATFRTNRLLAQWPLDQNPLLHPGENVVRVFLVALCIGLGLLSGLPAAALGWDTRAILPQVGWGSVAGLLIAAFYYITTRLVVAHSGTRHYSTRVLRIIVPRRAADFPAIALAMLPVVAMEELLFRSLLIGGLTPLLPLWVLLPASALLFGLMHSAQGGWGVIGVTVGGLALGLLFVYAESLLLPLWTHYVVNMAQLALAYRLGPGGLLTTEEISGE
jgi:membrane protease YdiL (CAAX protease family)